MFFGGLIEFWRSCAIIWGGFFRVFASANVGMARSASMFSGGVSMGALMLCFFRRVFVWVFRSSCA